MAYDGTNAAVLTNYSEVLKTFYLPAIQEQIPQMNPLSDLIQSGEKDVAGKNATINCHYGRNTGVFARADGGSFGDAAYQKHITATIPMKYNYGRVAFSGPTIAATRDQKGAYASVIDNEVSGLVKDLAREINRQLWGAGYGTLARWRSGTTTSMTLQKKYYGNSAGGDGFGSTFGSKYFKEFNHGVPVVLTEAGSTVTVATVDATNVAVSAITESTDYDTVTVTDADVTEATGTFYVRPGNMATVTAATSTAGAGRLEMMGLRGIVTNTDIDDIAFKGTDTGMNALADSLQGLAVGTYTWWKSKVDSASAGRYAAQRALTFKLFDKMFDEVAAEAGEGYGPDAIFTTRAIRREYKDLAAADRRLINTMTLDGGWKAIEHNGIPLLVDNDAIDGEIYFLTLKDLCIYRMSDFQWMEKDGSIFSRIAGYDAYEAVLFRYAEMGTTRRNVHGVITDVAYES